MAPLRQVRKRSVQDAGGVEPGALDHPHSSSHAACLEGLLPRLEATGVALACFKQEEGTFQIVAQAGRTILPMGLDFPVVSSVAVVEAGRGRVGIVTPATSRGPLDRFTASAAMRCTAAVPLPVEGGPRGAVLAFWPAKVLMVADPLAGVAPVESSLLGILLRHRTVRKRILVCHHDALAAEGLARRAELEVDAEVRIASSLDAVLAALDELTPDLVISPDRLSDHGVAEVAAGLRSAGSAAPLLVVSSDDTPKAKAGHCSGAIRYVALSEGLPRVLAIIRELLEGQTVPPAGEGAGSAVELTTRERQVLDGFNRGLYDKQIAEELGIAQSTVKTHARSIFQKLDASSRTAALYRARKLGLL